MESFVSESSPACGTCQANRGELRAPGGIIYDDGLWRLEHALEPVPLAGWLVLKPLRHVESMADLTSEEAAAFGPLVARVTAAIEHLLAPARTYLCLFAEADGFAHIHFHLIPRAPDLPREYHGPRIFEHLRLATMQGRSLADIREVERIAWDIRDALGQPDDTALG